MNRIAMIRWDERVLVDIVTERVVDAESARPRAIASWSVCLSAFELRHDLLGQRAQPRRRFKFCSRTDIHHAQGTDNAITSDQQRPGIEAEVGMN